MRGRSGPVPLPGVRMGLAFGKGEGSLMTVRYDKETTALLVIDPYNDFISKGGKVWDRLKAVAEANDCVPHMLQVLSAARKAAIDANSTMTVRG